MSTAFYIAKRYLFSKKSTNAINIISGISMLGVFVGSAALIIILSVFNGFEGLVLSMYSTFSPDIKIEASKGKTFDPNLPFLLTLKADTNIKIYTEVLQEKVLLRYGDKQFIGRLKGVTDAFLQNKAIDTALTEGEFFLHDADRSYAVIGAMVQYKLGISLQNQNNFIQIYAAKKGKTASLFGTEEFTQQSLQPVGVFESGQDWDDFVFVPLQDARTLLNETQNVSAIEINLKNAANADEYIQHLSAQAPKNLILKSRVQQNALLYKILNSEKWAVYFMLTFILIIAIFNIIGSLTMLVIDKKKDIAILISLGANKKLISRIFFLEGMMICLIGCIIGLMVGFIFCLLQQKYGFIQMGDAQSFVSAYPIVLKIKDFLITFLTVCTVSIIASGLSARLSVKHFKQVKESL